MALKKWCLLLCAVACVTTMAEAQKRKDVKELAKMVEESEVFSDIFTGFSLYDLAQDSFLYELEADKYFTPASNTKLLTFYTAWELLGDSIPVLQYEDNAEAFLFWGTGDPSFLNPNLPEDSTVLAFLRSVEKPLYFSTHNFKETRFGPGWAWEDYGYYFQPERSSFPIYGNVASFIHTEDQLGFNVVPRQFGQAVELDPDLDNRRPRFQRAIHSNKFRCNTRALNGRAYERAVPFVYSDELLVDLLTDTLGAMVHLYEEKIPIQNIQTLYSGVPADSVYQLLLQESDNFVAEQLLLSCANKVLGIQDVEQIIDYAKANLLQDLRDEPIWIDGSGLSRYNLFTPHTLVQLLEKMYASIPEEKLFELLPTGGVSGTIEDWYKGEEEAYIFAKTGTLSNKHCLSGYIKTKSGKTLAFSFMHNNYIKSSKPVKREMERIFVYIRDHF